MFFMISQVHYLGHTVSRKVFILHKTNLEWFVTLQHRQTFTSSSHSSVLSTSMLSLAKFIFRFSTVVCFVTEKSPLDMGPIATESVSACQTTTPPLMITSALLRTATIIACGRAHRPTDLAQYCPVRWQMDPRGRSPMPRGLLPRPNAAICNWTRKPLQLFLQWPGFDSIYLVVILHCGLTTNRSGI